MSGAVRLQRAAEACAFIEAPDYTVDRRGWRPPARAIDGPARAGIAGVIQAEHNVLIHLNGFPNALNFRRLLDSQRELSDLLADRVASAEPEPSASWAQRASTYAALHREARDLGGHVGDGSAALAEAAHAITRLRRLPLDARSASVRCATWPSSSTGSTSASRISSRRAPTNVSTSCAPCFPGSTTATGGSRTASRAFHADHLPGPDRPRSPGP